MLVRQVHIQHDIGVFRAEFLPQEEFNDLATALTGLFDCFKSRQMSKRIGSHTHLNPIGRQFRTRRQRGQEQRDNGSYET